MQHLQQVKNELLQEIYKKYINGAFLGVASVA